MAADEAVPQGDGEGRSAVGSDTLMVITTGRTTGLPHAVTVRFVFHEGAYLVIGAGRKSDWFTNALASKGGEVRLDGQAQTVAFEQFFDRGLVIGLFTEKYGPRTVTEWYSDPQIRSLKLTPTAPTVPRKIPRETRSAQDTD